MNNKNVVMMVVMLGFSINAQASEKKEESHTDRNRSSLAVKAAASTVTVLAFIGGLYYMYGQNDLYKNQEINSESNQENDVNFDYENEVKNRENEVKNPVKSFCSGVYSKGSEVVGNTKEACKQYLEAFKVYVTSEEVQKKAFKLGEDCVSAIDAGGKKAGEVVGAGAGKVVETLSDGYEYIQSEEAREKLQTVYEKVKKYAKETEPLRRPFDEKVESNEIKNNDAPVELEKETVGGASDEIEKLNEKKK